MAAHVSGQVARLRERFGAAVVLALEGLLARVATHMRGQGARVLEHLVASAIRASVFFLAALFFHRKRAGE